jgi:peroxiredoxin
MYGKKVEGIIRSSFLIDETGKMIASEYKDQSSGNRPRGIEGS